MTKTLPIVYTSYFARSGRNPRAVAISIRRPRFLPTVGHYPDLAPDEKLLKDYKSGRIDWRGYSVRFNNQLTRLAKTMVSKGRPLNLATFNFIAQFQDLESENKD